MADKKEYATRFGMGVLAALFLITSAGFSLLVIWQAKQNKNKSNAADSAQIQQAAQDALKNQQADKQTNKTEGNKLEGTKLTDFTPLDKVDSLQSTDIITGTGQEVKAGDTITAHYTGALVKDGTIFQSSHDSGQPFTSPLSGLIKGWQQGIPGMKVGGKRRLIIPADLAYGSQSQAGIPANSDLVFDIELISIGK